MKQAVTLACCLALALVAPGAFPQSPAYPSKPVRVILPFQGGADALARMVAEKMSASMGQPVLVENMLGAGGAIAADYVAKAAPDGYTLLLAIPDPVVNRLFLVKNMPYNTLRDFTPLSLIAEAVAVVVASNSAPGNSLDQLIAYAKANPGKLTYGTTGVGTSYHLAAESIKSASGADILHVPFKSGPQSLAAAMSGDVDLVFTVLATAGPQARSGKIRVMAVINDKRSALIPDVPSVKEIVPGFESPGFWMGYLAPAKLTPTLGRRLTGEITRAMAYPDVRAKFEEFGFSVIGSDGETFAAWLKNDIEKSGKIARAAGLTPE